MSIQSEIDRINNNVDTQTDLITQIKTALEGKGTGGGSNYSIQNPLNGANILDCENMSHYYKFNNFTPVKASMCMASDYIDPHDSYFSSSVRASCIEATNSDISILLWDGGSLEVSGNFSYYTTVRTFLVSFQDENNNILSDYFTCPCE